MLKISSATAARQGCALVTLAVPQDQYRNAHSLSARDSVLYSAYHGPQDLRRCVHMRAGPGLAHGVTPAAASFGGPEEAAKLAPFLQVPELVPDDKLPHEEFTELVHRP